MNIKNPLICTLLGAILLPYDQFSKVEDQKVSEQCPCLPSVTSQSKGTWLRRGGYRGVTLGQPSGCSKAYCQCLEWSETLCKITVWRETLCLSTVGREILCLSVVGREIRVRV